MKYLSYPLTVLRVLIVLCYLPFLPLCLLCAWLGKFGGWLEDAMEDSLHELSMVLRPVNWRRARKALEDAEDYKGRFEFFCARHEAMQKAAEYWREKAGGELEPLEPTDKPMPTLERIKLQPLP